MGLFLIWEYGRRGSIFKRANGYDEIAAKFKITHWYDGGKGSRGGLEVAHTVAKSSPVLFHIPRFPRKIVMEC